MQFIKTDHKGGCMAKNVIKILSNGSENINLWIIKQRDHTYNQSNLVFETETSAAATAGLATGVRPLSAMPQMKKSDIKVGLYSITFLGVWYKGRALKYTHEKFSEEETWAWCREGVMECCKYAVRAMTEIGYNGYMSYELCHTLPVVNGQKLGIEFAEKNAQLASEFMHCLINEAKSYPVDK